jgi:hypothetical protein
MELMYAFVRTSPPFSLEKRAFLKGRESFASSTSNRRGFFSGIHECTNIKTIDEFNFADGSTNTFSQIHGMIF